MSKLKIAFIGAGYMTGEHIKVFQEIQNVELVGIFSRTKSKAQQLADEFEIKTVSNSISELNERTNADAVVVSVSELSLNEVTKEVFKFPWVSLNEKPAGYNLDDAKAILNDCERNQRVAYVALNRRHYSGVKPMIKDLDSIDDKRLITIYDQEDPAAALAAGRPKDVVDNWMFANSVHLIDLFHLFGRGEVIEVEHVVKWEPENPFIVIAKLKYDSGDIGLYNAVWNAPGPWAVTVSTPVKRFEMRPLEMAKYQNKGERVLNEYPKDKWDQEFKPGLRKQAQLFVDSVTSGSNQGLPTLKDAYESMKLVSKIYSHE